MLHYRGSISSVVRSLVCAWLASACVGAATFATIYSFQGGSDGLSPQAAPIIDANGVLYGTTASGGNPGNAQCNGFGCGTVFSLAPPASPGGVWTKTILWIFGNVAGDGLGPYVLVPGSGGVLYGVTGGGGSGDCNCGTVFSLSPPASPAGSWTEEVLHSFSGGADGAGPSGLTLGAGGVLYGTTATGGASNAGTVYSVAPPTSPGGAWTETVLYSFKGGPADGSAPEGVVAGRDGVLYGVTVAGGSKTNAGTVFSLRPPSAPGDVWLEKVLCRFNGGRHAGGGENPLTSVVVGGGGVLYGTTGGIPTAFSLAPPSSAGNPWTETVLSKSSSLEEARGNIVLQSETETIYGASPNGGTSQSCGDSGCGAVWALSPPAPPGRAWVVDVLHTFGGADGGLPLGGVVESQGVLYGTALTGGAYGYGTVFAVLP
jgi:uncharacterized repeat protein (TIGR03803 family)